MKCQSASVCGLPDTTYKSVVALHCACKRVGADRAKWNFMQGKLSVYQCKLWVVRRLRKREYIMLAHIQGGQPSQFFLEISKMDPLFPKSQNCVFLTEFFFFFSILGLVIVCSVNRLLGMDYALYSIVIIIVIII